MPTLFVSQRSSLRGMDEEWKRRGQRRAKSLFYFIFFQICACTHIHASVPAIPTSDRRNCTYIYIRIIDTSNQPSNQRGLFFSAYLQALGTAILENIKGGQRKWEQEGECMSQTINPFTSSTQSEDNVHCYCHDTCHTLKNGICRKMCNLFCKSNDPITS